MFQLRPLLFFALAHYALAASYLRPTQLRCEYQLNPLAVQAEQPRLSWLLEAIDPARRSLSQKAYQIVVTDSAGVIWDSGRTESSQVTQIAYAGQPLKSARQYFWKVRVWDQDGNESAWSQPAQWTMGWMRAEDWKAKWISPPPGRSLESLPLFRYSFRVRRPVTRALVYVSGLGQYELRLNGAKVGDAVLSPGWTNYHKTVFYNTYDITSLLKQGGNAVGVMLGNGMYNVLKAPGRYTKFSGSFGDLKLIAQIHIMFSDGSSQDMATDGSWKVHGGPIVFSSAYGGEDYDANLLPAGWDAPGFADAAWPQASETAGPGGVLTAEIDPEIRVMHTYVPIRIAEPKPGIRVYDLGQNFSGWPRISVNGASGATVKMIPGELLDETGLVTQRGSGGPQWYSYRLHGSGAEVWRPRFSYYGFRYVQVEIAGDARIVSLEGQFVHSSSPPAGEFSCSKPLFNQIHALIVAAIQSNMQSLFTDCPHREKLGWLEQTHLLGSALMFNFDVARLYEKLANDIRDAQTSDGLVPDIAPEYVVFQGGFRDSPEWGSAAVLDPWIALRHYGDLCNLSAHFGEMQRYLEYLTAKSTGHLLSYGLGDWYDIGPGNPGNSKLTGLDLTATAVYYADIMTLARAAVLLGKVQEAESLTSLAALVKSVFDAKLYSPQTGIYDRGSQTAYAMPLAVGLVPAARRPAVLDKLVADIRAHNDHVTAGDIGFHYVLQALSEGGRSDVIFDMLSRTDAPSYGYQLAQGATALTEAWDANPRSSQNHFMLGHADEWFYRCLAGIDFDLSRPAGEQITLRPTPVGDLTSAQATYRSAIGTIRISWKRDNAKFILDADIPPNASAIIYVPARTAASVRESSRSASRAPGLSFLRQEAGVAVYRALSGRYHFESDFHL